MKNKITASDKELFYNNFSDQWGLKINDRETQKRLKIIYGKLLKKRDIYGKKFLEVGCGLGYFSNKASIIGAKVTGIDIGPELVKINKKKTPGGKFVVASASKLPFKSNSFDIVLSTEVIEHVENQKRAMKEMLRVLRPGGLLVITTPNRVFKPLFSFLSFIRIRPYRGNGKWFYPWEFKKFFDKDDTKIIEEVFFNFIYPIKPLDFFEKFSVLKYLMINQGYLVKKKKVN